MQGNIYLIGLMGAGKTTVGRKLAGILKREFFDADQLLESRTGVTISYIFEVEGEEGFRDRETALLRELGESPGSVVSTGGGAAMRPENQKVMGDSGTVVYLRASFGLLWSRLKGCQKRPLLQTDDPRGKIKALLEQRDPVYSQAADIVINVSSESPAKMARQIHQLIEANENR